VLRDSRPLNCRAATAVLALRERASVVQLARRRGFEAIEPASTPFSSRWRIRSSPGLAPRALAARQCFGVGALGSLAGVMFKCANTARSARSALSLAPGTWLSVTTSPAGDDPLRWTRCLRAVREQSTKTALCALTRFVVLFVVAQVLEIVITLKAGASALISIVTGVSSLV